MKYNWLFLLSVVCSLLVSPVSIVASSNVDPGEYDSDYLYKDTDYDDASQLTADTQSQLLKYFSGIPRSALVSENSPQADPDCEEPTSVTSSPSATSAPAASSAATGASAQAGKAVGEGAKAGGKHSGGEGKASIPETPPAGGNTPESEEKSKQLHQLIQHVYIAQARVQLEATEIKKAQAVADAAQSQLEEAANHVRAVTAALQTAQQEVASAAIRAQTAQLQLAAHDQLLFAARQDVDALSSQVVGLEAAEGISMPKITFDTHGLMERLRQPLPEAEKPTAIPSVVAIPPIFKKTGGGGGGSKTERKRSSLDYDYDYDYDPDALEYR